MAGVEAQIDQAETGSPRGRPGSSVASVLIALGSVAYVVVACLVAWFGDIAFAVSLAAAALLAAIAALVVRRSIRGAVVLAAIALALGLWDIARFRLPLWLLPALLVGFGLAYALGARFDGRPPSIAALSAVSGAVLTALCLVLVIPSGATPRSALWQLRVVDGIYVALLLALLSSALMARGLRLGGATALLALVVGSASLIGSAVAAGGIGPWSWLLWMAAALALLIAAGVAILGRSRDSASPGGPPCSKLERQH